MSETDMMKQLWLYSRALTQISETVLDLAIPDATKLLVIKQILIVAGYGHQMKMSKDNDQS